MTESKRVRRSERRWAVVRIALGLAQVCGATMAIAFLTRTGVNVLSLGTTAGTAAAMLLSVWLFAERKS